MEKYKVILICEDPIYPDFDKMDEEKIMKSLEQWGIVDINYCLEDGIEVTYDFTTLHPGNTLEGFKTLSMVNSEIYISFNYTENMKGLDIKASNTETPICTIPLQDFFSACLL